MPLASRFLMLLCRDAARGTVVLPDGQAQGCFESTLRQPMLLLRPRQILLHVLGRARAPCIVCVCVHVSQSVCLFVYLSVCLCMCTYTYHIYV